MHTTSFRNALFLYLLLTCPILTLSSSAYGGALFSAARSYWHEERDGKKNSVRLRTPTFDQLWEGLNHKENVRWEKNRFVSVNEPLKAESLVPHLMHIYFFKEFKHSPLGKMFLEKVNPQTFSDHIQWELFSPDNHPRIQALWEVAGTYKNSTVRLLLNEPKRLGVVAIVCGLENDRTRVVVMTLTLASSRVSDSPGQHAASSSSSSSDE